MSGDVSNQAHYAHGIEPIDYMRSRFSPEEFRGFLTGNVLKYVSRFQHKDGLKDLEKAQVYLHWLIQQERERLDLPTNDPRDPDVRDWTHLQGRVTEWAQRTFPDSTLNAQLEHIHEELTEVEETPSDEFEWADVLLIFMHAALEQGLTMADLYHACEKKFAIVQKRQWGDPDERGVVHHADRPARAEAEIAGVSE